MTLMRTIPPVTDEEALLAAIAAAPLDDAPRLVYADWLQERGQEAKAEYLRAVVSLVHPPENPAAVERCVILAEQLEAQWRQAVGRRFEVVMKGTGGIVLATAALRLALGTLFGEAIGPWHVGDPIRLKAFLTRERAEGLLKDFRVPLLLRLIQIQDPAADMFVRPMDRELPPTLFAPDEAL